MFRLCFNCVLIVIQLRCNCVLIDRFWVSPEVRLRFYSYTTHIIGMHCDIYWTTAMNTTKRQGQTPVNMGRIAILHHFFWLDVQYVSLCASTIDLFFENVRNAHQKCVAIINKCTFVIVNMIFMAISCRYFLWSFAIKLIPYLYHTIISSWLLNTIGL